MSTATNPTLHGSCLCLTVQYELDGPPIRQVLCHCTNCKKFSGSSFAANWWYKNNQLRITSGSSNIRAYESTKTDDGRTTRSFCMTCGSPLFITTVPAPEIVVVASGTLDAAPEGAPTQEYYAKNRVGWMCAVEGATQSQGLE